MRLLAFLLAFVGSVNAATLDASKLVSTDSARHMVSYAGTTPAACTNQFLRNFTLSAAGVGSNTCATVNLTSDVTSILPYNLGGTGQSSYAAGDFLYASAINTLAKLTVGSAGQVLRSTGTLPAWSTATYPNTVTANQVLHGTSTNVVGGSANLTFDGSALKVGSGTTESSALIGIRGSGNALEWGFNNFPGLGSTLGAEAGAGYPFLAFNVEAGTNNNTYRTRGFPGVVLRPDLAGGLGFYKVATATADNQSLTTLATLSNAGSFAATGGVSGTTLTASGLTSGRVPFVTTGGLLTDSSQFTFSGGRLLVANSGTAEVFVQNTTGGAAIFFKAVGGVDTQWGTANNVPVSIYTNDLLRWRIAEGTGNLSNTGSNGTAGLHLKAGTTAASTAPLKFTSGPPMTAAEAMAVEAQTDDLFFTITTGAARKAFVLDDGARLTSGRIPVATTNGRLIDGPTPVKDATYNVDCATPGNIASFTTTKGLITAVTTC